MDLSVLDLVPILDGETATQGFQHSLDLARHTESLGYKRFWVAEHHDTLGLASSSPEIIIGHIANGTSQIRVGSGGIMLPNHTSLHVAEMFRTIEAMHPGRIDLGLGRAPGSHSRAAFALRRGGSLQADDFPQQVEELIGLFHDEYELKATPVGVSMPEIWILGSSDFGARFAAKMGLPFAFAQHFSQLDPLGVLRLYKREFQPSAWLDKPRAMMGSHIICAETDEEADELALPSDVLHAAFVTKGSAMPLQSIEKAREAGLTQDIRGELRRHFPKFVGSPEAIRRQFEPYLAELDELIVLSMIHDQESRHRSYALTKNALSGSACGSLR